MVLKRSVFLCMFMTFLCFSTAFRSTVSFRFQTRRMIFSVADHNNNSVVEEKNIKKMHSVTVCLVPPPHYQHVWETVSDMRLKLKDPGFYRWPPHANLLYPFLDMKNEDVSNIVATLKAATIQVPPFRVMLNEFGTFGGKQRGVLWLHPESSPLENIEADNDGDGVAPLVKLQQKLEEAFPMCKDQSQKGGSKSFTPHMTLSHFQNLDDALQAQENLQLPIDNPLEFIMDRVYLLERKGDGGQFLRVAEIGLGQDASKVTQVFYPPSPFPAMPAKEEEWVYEERMKLKARRNKRGNRGGQRSRRRRSRGPRIPDTPEVIAAKRAERKAKRERLEQEAATGEVP